MTYAASVCEVLAREFEWSARERQVIEEAVLRQVSRPDRTFELILDSPASASWRLKNLDGEHPAFRVADYRLGQHAPRERIESLNQTLLQLRR